MSCQHHKKCQRAALERAKDACEALGARFTEQREAVYKVLWQSHKAMTAADIMHEIHNNQAPITYRALDFLKKAGLVHHIHALNAYVGCTHSHKHGEHGILLICKKCMNVEECHEDNPTKVMLEKLSVKKFAIEDVHVEILGVCSSCR